MEPVTLIAAAVAAGAATGMGDAAKSVVTDSYTALKRLLSRKYGVIDAVVVDVENDPEEVVTRQYLARKLETAGAGSDLELLAAAEDVLRVVEENEAAAAAAVGITLTRLSAGSDITVTDIAAVGGAITASNLNAGGSITISGLRTERGEEPHDPSAAPR